MTTTCHRNRRRRKTAALLSVVLFAASLTTAIAAPASAATCAGATITFDGSTSDFWDVATNWSGDVLPSASDQACIPAGKTAVVRDSSPVATTVAVEGTLHVTTGTLTASGGYQTVTAAGNGAVDVDAGGVIAAPVVAVQGSASLLLAGGTLTGDLETDVSTHVSAWGNIDGDLRAGGPIVIGQHQSTTAHILQVGGNLVFTPDARFVLDWLDDGGLAGADYDAVHVTGHLYYYAGLFEVDNPTSNKLGNGKAFTPLTYSSQSCSMPTVMLNDVPGVTLSLDIQATSTSIVSSGTPPAPPAPVPDGYWLATSDGNVIGAHATDFGSMAGTHLNAPIVGIAATPDHGGYWLAAADGGVFAFGDATFFGSMAGEPLRAPIVGIAADPDGAGYLLTAADGGVFAFAAAFAGSAAAHPINQPVVGIAADADGTGYWLVAADGGVFAYGAPYFGSGEQLHMNAHAVGLLATDDGTGYRMAGADGGVFAFAAAFQGSATGTSRVVGITGFGDGTGSLGASSSEVRSAC